MIALAGLTFRTSTRLAMGAALLACAAARGAEADGWFTGQVWVNPGIYSHHIDTRKDLRGNNVGLGAELALARSHALVAGSIINSVSKRTHYAGYAWRPLHFETGSVRWSAGVAVTALDGYPRVRNGDWFVVPLPVVSAEWERFGVNFIVIPELRDRVDGAIGIQVKLRVW